MGFFKLKTLIILSMLTFLCGCSANYEIEVKNGSIRENSQILVNKTNESIKEENGFSLEEELEYTYNSIHDIDNGQEETKTKHFELNKINNKDNIGLSYNNQLTFNNYEESPLIHQCYENINIINKTSSFSINTDKYFKCFDYYKYLDSVTITLKSDYKVLNTNADEEKKGIYYWYINKNNYTNKRINIDLSKEPKTVVDKVNLGDYSYIVFILLGLSLIILGLVVFIKVKNSNKKS